VLSYLSINNFVLIEQLQINFEDDLSIITGETGAGKSILLGALGLVLGVRADLSTIKDKSRKCVIEATFKIKDYNLKSFFETHDLDYEEETLIRREILPSGKSRAFINDTPIVLSTLQNLSQSLIDVHSQQDTQRLNDLAFQFQIIDSLAKTQSDLSQFQKTFEELKNLEFELEQLKADQKEKQRNYEYNQFIYDELVKAQLKPDELEELESSLEKLEHIDLIAQSLNTAITLTETEEFGLQEALQKYKLALETVARYDSNFSEIFERANSLKIEFDDINEAVLDYQERMNLDPQELLTKQNRLNLINGLLQKHHVVTVADLIQKQEALEIDIENVEQAEALFKDKEKHIQQLNASLLVLGEDIHKKRKAIIPNLQKQLENYLEQLGMQKARFAIRLTATKQFFTHGIDQLEFLFSANQGVDFGKMAKVD
jgi:DNA repair protein RecN (Recombination protein N)